MPTSMSASARARPIFPLANNHGRVAVFTSDFDHLFHNAAVVFRKDTKDLRIFNVFNLLNLYISVVNKTKVVKNHVDRSRYEHAISIFTEHK
ncbi:MAG: hypothetical protein J3R72DRAFT_494252 [Linnemannia gamsii]|nr:MAG: hypothetical protein J3R72DRAFT_494252 [Linnemannia gamsii]